MTSITMRDRIARGLWDHDERERFPDDLDYARHAWGEALPSDQERYRGRADAVLQALAKPTPEMRRAGNDAQHQPGAGGGYAYVSAEDVWRAMITAAQQKGAR